eukprot:9324743-Pyramimonas_sp.AAC.1
MSYNGVICPGGAGDIPAKVEQAMPPQKVANLLTALECVRLLTASTLPPADRAANQAILMKTDTLGLLLPLALKAFSTK